MARSAAEPETMVGQMPHIAAYLVHVDSLLAMGGLAIVLSLLEWVGALPGEAAWLANVGARLIWCTYFFLVARKAALGKLRLPVPTDFRDPVDALIKPLLAVCLASCWFWGVAGMVSLLALDMSGYLDRFQAHPLIFLRQQGAVGYLLFGAGLFFLPVAAISALCGAPRLWHQLNPLHGLRMIWRVPRAYTAMYALLCALALFGFALEALGGRLAEVLPIPLVAPVIRHLMRLWVPLAQARLVGGFVYHNRRFMRPETVDV